jgi:hypothetical protein
MNLDRQIKLLIDNAPQDGHTPQAMTAIAPVLKLLAKGLQHSEYYILQTLDKDWVMTTLSNRAQPEVEKNVVYAFSTVKDATDFQSMPDPRIITLKLPVTHILFQLFAMQSVDSIVFFDTPGNLASGIEVLRADLQNLIETQLQQKRSAPRSNRSNIPPDIA